MFFLCEVIAAMNLVLLTFGVLGLCWAVTFGVGAPWLEVWVSDGRGQPKWGCPCVDRCAC